jgi:hypothetical protein
LFIRLVSIYSFSTYEPRPIPPINIAQESDQPTSADKGKGKAVEKSKDDKPVANGKKDGQDKKDG